MKNKALLGRLQALEQQLGPKQPGSRHASLIIKRLNPFLTAGIAPCLF